MKLKLKLTWLSLASEHGRLQTIYRPGVSVTVRQYKLHRQIIDRFA